MFLVLGMVFISNALLAEFIGVKIFSLERSLGLEPLRISLLGIPDLGGNFSAGVILWPFVFVLTDLVNEYFGRKGVRFLSFLTAGLISYAFLMVSLAIWLAPADFWTTAPTPDGDTINLPAAYRQIFGQGMWIIIGSLVAFLIGQVVDVVTFHAIKQRTGNRYVWLRATGSTAVSQLIDSFVVLFIAFYIGAGWSLNTVLAIAIVNYTYKLAAAIVLTPVLLLVHQRIDRYLGPSLSTQLMTQATER